MSGAHFPEILIASHTGDDHVRPVLDALAARGIDAFLFDTASYPRHAAISLGDIGGNRQSVVLHMDGDSIEMSGVQAAWWRRPLPIELDPAIVGDDRQFAYGEASSVLAAFWSCLDCAWINPPSADDIAGRKAYQLRLAHRAGLNVPRTLMTSDPDAARAFISGSGPGGTIYKTFTATERVWRETRLLKPEEEATLDDLTLAPVIFQDYVPGAIDLRIIVVGRRIFAAAFRTPRGEYAYDYRLSIGQAEVMPWELPGNVAAQLLDLMGRLGLVYGAIDMRVTPEGAHVFLEVNPSGQWIFVEERTGQPITEAFADELLAQGGLSETAEPHQLSA